ncbi:MAG TPA: efflux RND transporter permease subunit [Candidatus Sulfotelmatobacter sp.]|nr:efflux RND transporter permease subunit [Candidatus Sulfotelmatobacter sp.]
MSGFAIRNPYFILVVCVMLLLIGTVSLVRMPVDLFPAINIPVVDVATFYSGMPPEDIETDITNRFERFFTLASGVDHMESRSLPGVSIIKVYFQPGTDPDADLTQLSNLALADLRRLPPGTLPPVVLKFDASSLPVCLVTLKGQGLTETQLRDYGQFQIRDQIAVIKGAEVPPPFGGKYRQIMVYVDPYKLLSRGLSVMDVVNAVNKNNLILPAGDVKVGSYDYYVYTNALVDQPTELNSVPLKTVGERWVSVADVGQAEDAHQIQYNLVRVDGQRSTYLPIMKQGGKTNTIEVVDGVRGLLGHLFGLPKTLQATVVFDQSAFVKEAIKTLLHEALIGLVLTSLMILLFLASARATLAVFLSIPLSALTTLLILYMFGTSLNTMVLGGLALAFSRIIDNSVISLENIYRHLESGAPTERAAEEGGAQVNLAVLAATLTAVVVFIPVVFLYGVSKFLFSALALAVAIALFASYFVAMTVIPLFCARYLRYEKPGLADASTAKKPSLARRFHLGFDRGFVRMLDLYERTVRKSVQRPGLTVAALAGAFLLSLTIYPFIGLAFFPRTDAGQFSINLKVPTGTRIEVTEQYVARVEDLIRKVVGKDLHMIVSTVGLDPGFASLYTTNSGEYTTTIQVQLNGSHAVSSFAYMDRVREQIATQYPEFRTFFSSGSMVDAVLNMGMLAPIDVQVASADLQQANRIARDLAEKIRTFSGVGEAYIPQDMDYPAVRLDVDRVHTAELGLSPQDVIRNVITALNSNLMIAPNYWLDRKTGNDYFLTVQYFEHGSPSIHDFVDLRNIPLRGPNVAEPTTLDTVVKLTRIVTPTEVDHYQIQRVNDVYVTPKGEDLGRVASKIRKLIAGSHWPEGVRVNLRGMVNSMQESFKSFGKGLGLAAVLLYLILVAQFKSFKDPFLIMLAIPMGFIGVLVILPLTHTTLNVMSLMGVLMLVGIAASNSILIVDFAHLQEKEGLSMEDAIIRACRVRLRPILMTSLATIIGMVPMALKLGTGSEQYAPLARAIIGGLTASVILTVYLVPAAYVLAYRRRTEVSRPEA